MGFKGKSIEEIWMIRKWRGILGKEEHKARQDMFNTDSIALRTLKRNIADTQSDNAFKAYWGYPNHKELPDIGPVEYAQSELTTRQNSQTLLCCMLAMWNGNVHLPNIKRIRGQHPISPLRHQFEVCLNKFCPDKVDEILEEFECEDWDEYKLELEGKTEELEEYKSYKKIIGGKMWNGSVTLAE